MKQSSNESVPPSASSVSPYASHTHVLNPCFADMWGRVSGLCGSCSHVPVRPSPACSSLMSWTHWHPGEALIPTRQLRGGWDGHGDNLASKCDYMWRAKLWGRCVWPLACLSTPLRMPALPWFCDARESQSLMHRCSQILYARMRPMGCLPQPGLGC